MTVSITELKEFYGYFERIAEAADGRRRLALKSPATLEPIGELVVLLNQMCAAVAKARQAQKLGRKIG